MEKVRVKGISTEEIGEKFEGQAVYKKVMREIELTPVNPADLKDGQEILVRAKIQTVSCTGVVINGCYYNNREVVSILPKEEKSNLNEYMDISELPENAKKFMIKTCEKCRFKKESPKIDWDSLKIAIWQDQSQNKYILQGNDKDRAEKHNKLVDIVKSIAEREGK
jgi:hypothetical protein